MVKGKIIGFDFEQQKNGTFLYKAHSNPILEKKVVKEKDKPQYKIIDNIEDCFTKQANEMVQSIEKEVIQFLNII